jgi:hypothetical protein
MFLGVFRVLGALDIIIDHIIKTRHTEESPIANMVIDHIDESLTDRQKKEEKLLCSQQLYLELNLAFIASAVILLNEVFIPRIVNAFTRRPPDPLTRGQFRSICM